MLSFWFYVQFDRFAEAIKNINIIIMIIVIVVVIIITIIISHFKLH